MIFKTQESLVTNKATAAAVPVQGVPIPQGSLVFCSAAPVSATDLEIKPLSHLHKAFNRL